jgi:hypothetical protein
MMKPFQTYIFELNKPSEFRIKLAGINPAGDVMEKIKNALDAYQLESVSTVKSLPIQEHREFPRWGGPCEAYQFDVKLAYPTTNIAVRQLIKERAGINVDWISVRNLNESIDTEEAEARGQDHEGALLDENELKDEPGAQELAGQSRIGSLLKELESRKFEFAAEGEKTGVMSTENTGDTSPVGTSQNTVYRKPKGN